jgi:methylmalonyl-CoA mutase N-terminal domain/subunit
MKERREKFETSSGIELPNDFNPTNTKVDFEHEVGEAGEFPYTRGVRRNMYRGRFWTMRQYAGFATAEESNARYKYLLANGTTGLSVAFDLPTQIGLDSDDELAAGEVGKVGVAIDSLEDMLRLFDKIPLDTISTRSVMVKIFYRVVPGDVLNFLAALFARTEMSFGDGF